MDNGSDYLRKGAERKWKETAGRDDPVRRGGSKGCRSILMIGAPAATAVDFTTAEAGKTAGRPKACAASFGSAAESLRERSISCGSGLFRTA